MVGTDLDLVFRALAAPARRSLLDQMISGPRRVHELVLECGISQSACSQHLAVLRAAGLAERRSDGRWVRDAALLIDVEEWLSTHTFTWAALRDGD